MTYTIAVCIVKNSRWWTEELSETCSRIRTDPSWSCSQAVWHIPLLCVQWKTPDDGQRNCPKHVDFYSKKKFEKLVHLLGCIIRRQYLPSITNKAKKKSLFKTPVDTISQVLQGFTSSYIHAPCNSSHFGQNFSLHSSSFELQLVLYSIFLVYCGFVFNLFNISSFLWSI